MATLKQAKLLFVFLLGLTYTSQSPTSPEKNTYGKNNDNDVNNFQGNDLGTGKPPGGYVQYNPLDDKPVDAPNPKPYGDSGTQTGRSSTDSEDIDKINAINVYDSTGSDTQAPNITARLFRPYPTSSAPTQTCQQALDQCSLFNVDTASLHNVYQEAFTSMMQKQRLQYQDNLVGFRDFFINMMNKFIMNPDLTMSGGGVCYGANSPVIIQRDPTSNLPNPNSIQDVNVPPLQQCVVSEWSEWSAPLAFGIIERTRTIIRQGQCCPDDLLQRVNISSYINQNVDVFQDPNNVAQNFHNSFINQEPRDILLVIDTSSSIFRDDFEIMKEGIKIMIDLFCGGFGMGPRNNRLAIIQFSSAPIIIHYFSDPQTPKALKDKVGSMVDFGGKTCTGDALVLAYREIFQLSRGARPDTPNDTLVVTDGRANCGKDLLQSARLLQQRSQAVYALGIGIAGDVAARAQVTSLVTGEDPHHIFSLARYPDFKEMIDYIKYRQHGQKCVPLVSAEKKYTY